MNSFWRKPSLPVLSGAPTETGFYWFLGDTDLLKEVSLIKVVRVQEYWRSDLRKTVPSYLAHARSGMNVQFYKGKWAGPIRDRSPFGPMNFEVSHNEIPFCA